MTSATPGLHTSSPGTKRRGAAGFRAILLPLMLLSIAVPASAQDGNQGIARRARNRPILRVKSVVPTAPVRDLEFATDADGTVWLYSGGQDKVVRRWRLDADNNRLVHEETLRWPIFRGIRGVILELAVHQLEAGHRIAVGGIGAKAPQVNIIEPGAPQNALSLVDLATAGRQNVHTLNFHPSGDLLAVGEYRRTPGVAANLLLWDIRNPEALRVACIDSGLANIDEAAFSPDGQHIAIGGRLQQTQAFAIHIYRTQQLLDALRAPEPPANGQAATSIAPVETIPVASNLDRAVAGLYWTDNNTWHAGTHVGMMRGQIGQGAIDRAGFDETGQNVFYLRGLRAMPSGGGTIVRNLTPLPLDFRFSKTAQPLDWQNDRLAPGAERNIAGVQSGKLERLLRGQPTGTQQPLPAGYRLDYFPNIARCAASSNGTQVLALQDPDTGLGTLALRTGNGNLQANFSDPELREIHCVAISPDGAFVAAAGPDSLTLKDETHPAHHIRVWSTNTRRTVARVPDPAAGDELAGLFGAPMADVRIGQLFGNHTILYRHGHRGTADGSFHRYRVDNLGRAGGVRKAQQSDVPALHEKGLVVASRKPDVFRVENPQQKFPQDFSGRYFEKSLELKDGWHRVAVLRNQFGWIRKTDVAEMERWTNLRPGASVAGHGVLVSSSIGQLQVGRDVAARVGLGAYFREAAPSQDGKWFQVGIPGRPDEKAWIHGSDVASVPGWPLLDERGEVLLTIPQCFGDPPLCAARWKSGGRDLVAVGRSDGLEILDVHALDQPGANPIIRSFYGHDAEVTSLCFSYDGTWLISGAADGTINAWSLKQPADVKVAKIEGDANAGDTLIRELGMWIDNGGKVSAVISGWPGWEAGFAPGQRLSSLKLAGLEVAGNQIVTAMRQLTPGRELFAEVSVGQQRRHLLTPVRHDPLWTLYPRLNGRWVLWTPQGYFDRSSAEQACSALGRTGDFEWCVNMLGINAQAGADAGVIAMDAGDFELEYRVDPRLIANPDDDLFSRILATCEPVPDDLPLPPVMRLQVTDRRNVQFEVSPSAAGDAIVERSIWLNGKRLKREKNPPAAAGVAQLRQADFRPGRNRVLGIATVQKGNRTITYRSLAHFDAPAVQPPQPGRLHYLGVGVTKLDQELAQQFQLSPLKYTHRDVIAVGGTLLAAGQLTLQRGSIQLLAEPLAPADQVQNARLDSPVDPVAPTQKNLLGALDHLRGNAQVQPNDLVIVMLSGHGTVHEGEFKFLTRDSAVTRSQVIDKLADLPCPTLLILDACHSQAMAGQLNEMLNFGNVLPGPMVLSSCGRDELSQEHGNVKHGIFTLALIEALTRKRNPGLPGGGLDAADADKDGHLSIGEICRYTQCRTSHLLDQEIQIPGATQHPQLLLSAGFVGSDAIRFLKAPR